jgi:translocation and assembly module TamA
MIFSCGPMLAGGALPLVRLVRAAVSETPRLATPAFAICLLIGALPDKAWAFKLFGYAFFEDEKRPPAPDAQSYSIDMPVTTSDEDLADRVRAASLLYSEKDDTPPPSTAAFLSRARAEYDRITAALYANGHYGPTLAITVNGKPVETLPGDATLPRPVKVQIAVDPGPVFTFGSIEMAGRAPAAADEDDRIKAPPEKLGLVPGGIARSEIVLQSEKALVDEWRQLGYPKAANTPRNVAANHPARRLNVEIGVESGRPAVYGPVLVEGTSDMDPDFVRWQTGLEPGRPYDPDDLARAQRRLRRLQVFGSTSIAEAGSISADGSLPLTLTVVERPLHVFGVGASYSTIDGAGVEGYWEHRNLFGRAERLRLDARISGIDSVDPEDFTYLAGVTFIKPGVFTPVTDMTAAVTASREVYDPYSQNTFRARLGLAHEFTEQLIGTVAINGEFDHVDDGFGERDLIVASLPSSIAYDGSDNRLEPTRGYRAKMSAEPFHEIRFGNTGVFTRLDASAYFSFGEDARTVVAVRGATGSIFGAPADELPADRLFFAGGGGSVRGYAYRSLGPRVDGDIVGGRSLVEGSLEVRVKVTDTIGVVPFVDAGGAFESTIPDFSEEIKVGAGIGLRYYTGIGAIRLDLATPVNPDPGDSRFAFYIGLGESF